MGMRFEKSWPETAKKVSNETLGKHLQGKWGKDAGQRHEDVIQALALLEGMGDISRDEMQMLIHGGSLETSKFLTDIDEVVRNNKGHDENVMAMEGLRDGIRSVVNKTRLEFYDDNGFDSNTKRSEMEEKLVELGQARSLELQSDKPFDMDVEEEADADVKRDEITGAPQLTFDSMDDED